MIKFKYILDKRQFGGQEYYKILVDDLANKIINNMKMKVKMKHWDTKVAGLLDSKDFLLGIDGIATVFTIDDTYMLGPAPENLKGTWIHRSMLIHFVTNCGADGLLYIAERMEHLFRELYQMRSETELLKTNKNLFVNEKLELKVPEIKLEPKNYTLKVLNNLMKKSGVSLHINNTKKYKVKWMFKDIILDYLITQNIIVQKDTHFYVIAKPTKGLSVYRPANQGNATYNKEMSAVQYVQFKPYYLTTLFEELYNAQLIEKISVK